MPSSDEDSNVTTIATSKTNITETTSLSTHGVTARTIPRKKSTKQWITGLSTDMLASLISGSLQAGLFNPWDRALYLSVCHRRPFLDRHNFVSPYKGFSQAVVQRIISGGLYFFLQSYFRSVVEPAEICGGNIFVIQLIVGVCAGALNGMILNQLTVVKYHAWNNREGISFWKAARQLYQQGGLSCFFNGMNVTGVRDTVFGAVYETLRVLLRSLTSSSPHSSSSSSPSSHSSSSPPHKPMKQPERHLSYFVINMISAVVATIASAPFNYVRTIKYSVPVSQPSPSTWSCLVDLKNEILEQESFKASCAHAQQRLRIGWGTARVGVGMALGQHSFDLCKRLLQEKLIGGEL